ncbi:MAG: hypothetical protein CM15mP122_1630 [Bacteroidota bacterium]|nr:MAG: hypothetical protein CM15mP122_1630 [Bacteroidota bacterium]
MNLKFFKMQTLNFINNAIYLLCVIIMTALAFYLIRRTQRIKFTYLCKGVMTLFCVCVIFLAYKYLLPRFSSERNVFTII